MPTSVEPFVVQNGGQKPFDFKRGVFQGDPLSPTIFLCVFNPLLEYILSESKHGYHLNSETPVICTPFADDFNIITTNSRSHQRIISNVEKFAKSMNLILEPTKCKSLSIASGRSKIVNFQLSDKAIPSLATNPEKFLGSQITYSGKQSDVFEYIQSGFQTTLDNIDASLIRDDYKLRVYSQYMLPAIRFKLTVHEITSTNLRKLDALTDKFIKKWLKMPPSATLAVIHANEGLGIKSISHIYREAHAIAHSTSRLKADSQVNVALNTKLSREGTWLRKDSISTYSEDHFLNSSTDKPNKPDKNYIETVKKRVKQTINTEFKERWSNHLKKLTVQGKFLEILTIEESNISWKSVIYNLPKKILQFATNACIDTLATNANLKRWGKRVNAKCPLCEKYETLHHVLNNCAVMLDRYTWRHDSILSCLYSNFKEHLLPNFELLADLPGKHAGITTIPIDVIITSQRPDIVFIDKPSKLIILVELSIPFELNIEATHQRKVERYKDLIQDIQESGYTVKYYPIEIGSRAFISKENTSRLKSVIKITTQNQSFKNLKDTICKIALTASFVIYHSKFENIWCSPPFVTF